MKSVLVSSTLVFLAYSGGSSACYQRSEHEFIFLKKGKTLAELGTQISRKGQEKYKNAKSITLRNDCTASAADRAVLSIDWLEIGNSIDLEMCVFWMANRSENIEDFKEFLILSGFENIVSENYNPLVAQSLGIKGAGLLIQATIPLESLPRGFGGFLGNELWGSHGLSVGIFTNSDGAPFDVNVTVNRK